MTINKHDTLETMLLKSNKNMTYSDLLKSLAVLNDVLETGYHTGISYKDIWTAKDRIQNQIKLKEVGL